MTNIKIGLDSLGLQDSHHLKSALINCEDPLKAISDFQEENSILLPTLKPALPLLDLHNVKRLDFHQSVTDELKEKLTKRIEELADSKTQDDFNKLEELLDKSFPVINIPRLTNLVFLIMKQLPKINLNYLNYVQENNCFYQMSPIEVKRQIWINNEELYFQELNPLFEKCLQHFEEQLLSIETSQRFIVNNKMDNFSDKILDQNQINLLKSKRHNIYINEIVKMIGNNGKLYYNTVNYTLKLYLNTKNWNYASIRSLLLMKLHDVDNIDLSSSENIYKFTWTLNSCLKERKIDSKRIKELESIVDSKKFEKILFDISFILADCFAIDTLAYTAIVILFNKSVQNEILPRNSPELLFILRLLSLGLQSWDIISNANIKKEPKIDVNIITKYLCYLTFFMADYHERAYEESTCFLNFENYGQIDNNNLQNVNSDIESFSNDNHKKKKLLLDNNLCKDKTEILEEIKKFNTEYDICCVLTSYYLLECIELNDWNSVNYILPIIKFPENNSNFEKWFISQFVKTIYEHIEYLKIEWISKLVLNNFLFKNMKTDISYELIYKLLDKLYNIISLDNYMHLIDEIKPKKWHSTNLQLHFNKLKSRLENTHDLNK